MSTERNLDQTGSEEQGSGQSEEDERPLPSSPELPVPARPRPTCSIFPRNPCEVPASHYVLFLLKVTRKRCHIEGLRGNNVTLIILTGA